MYVLTDELLQRDVAVSLLSVKEAVLVWRVLDVEGVVLMKCEYQKIRSSWSGICGQTHVELANIVLDDRVSTVCLVDTDLALLDQLMFFWLDPQPGHLRRLPCTPTNLD